MRDKTAVGTVLAFTYQVAMEPRINEQYFQRLLASSDPIEAVYNISMFWDHRLNECEPYFGLSEPEWRIVLIQTYTGQVLNGGHSQYFLNRGKKHSKSTVSALIETSLNPLSEILKEALEVVTDADDELAKLTKDDFEKLASLDQKLFEQLDVEAVLLEHLRINQSNVLIPERGLL